jgi:hypothetical protein
MCSRLVTIAKIIINLNITNNLVRFEVLTAIDMEMGFSWDVAPCNLVDIYQPTFCYPDGGGSNLL